MTEATAAPDTDLFAGPDVEVGQDADFSDGYDLQSWGHVGSELGEGQHDELEGMRPVGRGRPLRSELPLQGNMLGPPSKTQKLPQMPVSELRDSLQPLDVLGMDRRTGSSSFDFHLQDSCLRLQRDNPVQLPWETGFGPIWRP